MDLTFAFKNQLLNVYDLMAITGYKKSKCFAIMKYCRRYYNGSVPHAINFITSDSLLLYFNVEKEDSVDMERD